MTDKSNIMLTIDQIKVMIDTNIPNKIGKPIELTRSILHYESVKEDSYYTLSNYPYFTRDVKYPKNYLNTLDYRRRVEFFFSNEKFKELLLEKSVYSENITPKSDTDNPVEKTNMSNADDDVSEIVQYNIETMIQLLFPTKFPIINNYTNSFDHFIQKKPNFDFTFKNAIPIHLSGVAPHLPVTYSYLKIDDKIYTNTKIIWLNDVINHPVYRDLMNSYIIFDKWRLIKRGQLVEEIKNQKQKLKSVLGRMDSSKIAEYINDIDENITKSSTKATGGPGIAAMTVERNNYIKKLVDQIKKVYDNIDEDVYMKVENLREIFNITTYNVIIPKEFKTHLNNIFGISKQIGLLTDIHSKYFKEEMNIHFEDDSAEMKQLFQSRFKDYIEFIKKIEKYNKPIIESENAELQKIIYGYTQGFDNIFPLYLDYVKNKYIYKQPKTVLDETVKKLEAAMPKDDKSTKKIDDLIYIGVNITENITAENPRYSIYLQVDLIGGEVNNANKSKILCKYKGEHYGDQFVRFKRKNKGLNTYEVPKKRMYFDMDEMKTGNKPNNKKTSDTKKRKNTESTEKKEKGVKGGRFYRFTRKCR